MIDLNQLIETVREQGCVKLKNGREGIPREIKINPEYEIVDVDTDDGHYEVEIDDIEEIVSTG